MRIESVRAQIVDSGGLQKYQAASIEGQSAQRGGDSSKVLVEWLLDILDTSNGLRKMKLLEVGALCIDNACLKSGLFEVERIDLHSQHPDIKEQDFMQRPTPESEALDQEGFDLVSLSLVVNFVATPNERGEMLRRVEAFLRPSEYPVFPALFLVLPAPCVTNSRYLDEDRLEAMLNNLGYIRIRRKMSEKLMYSLWRFEKTIKSTQDPFKKAELRSGKSRNNFAIVLR